MAAALSLSNNPLTSLFAAITPPPPYSDYDYDGIQFRWNIFVFRPALFKLEAFLLLAVLLYVATFLLGKARNTKRAEASINELLPLLSAQFSSPTTTGLISNGYSDFFNFSTGRRNIISLHTVFALEPRQDLLLSLYRFAYGLYDLLYTNQDTVELDFRLAQNTNASYFVWGVVAKEYLTGVKQDRWDLSFVRTTESPLIGGGYCVMSEFADVSENLLKPDGPFNLGKVLNDPTFRPYIKSLTISDQPREAPTVPTPPEKRERHLVLSLRLPPSRESHVIVPLVRAMFNVVNNLDAKLVLRPETKSKLKKIREDVDERIRKELQAEKKEEAELDKVAAKKRAEDERISKLSAVEQRKVIERERKRAMRKSQGKAVKKA